MASTTHRPPTPRISPPRIAALTLWVVCVVLIVVTFWAIFSLDWSRAPADVRPAAGDVLGALPTLVAATVGLLIVWRQPKNLIGWLLLLTPAFAATLTPPKLYAGAALYLGMTQLPAPLWVLWAGGVFWAVPFMLLLVVLPLLYPDGRLPGPRWRLVLVLPVLTILIGAVAAFDPTLSMLPGHRNPAAIGAFAGFGKTFGPLLEVLFFAGAVLAIASLVVRYRRGDPLRRQQIKWLIAGGSLLLAAFAVDSVLPFNGNSGLIPTAASALPIAIGIAVLRYRLYDLDVIINKALVYGGLAAVITVVYVLLVVNIGGIFGGGRRFGLSLVVTAVIALAFQPLRHRAQRLANRLVYGKRATPYEVLSEFSQHLAETYAGEDVLHRMTRILGEGTGAQQAELWIKTGHDVVRTATWPADSYTSRPMSNGTLPEIPADHVVPITHQGETLGALALTKKRGESLSTVEANLMSNLAKQAGLVLENAGLNRELLARLEELRASRERLVTVQDEERRRIERNLHDGAQQELVALNVKLALLDSLIDKDPAKAKEIASQVRQEAKDAVETLRELAHGIYPPLLASEGLGTALQAQARKSAVPVNVEIRQFARPSMQVEAAIYFCCLEALQNVAKYASASHVWLRLWTENARLQFEVRDDGKGFDAATSTAGAGLQNMRDRIDALGGELRVTSAAGQGTTVSGSVPTG